MVKIAVGIEYNGAHYYGWQSQALAPNLQDVITCALSKVANESIVLEAAGRTDKGVHATQQVAHFKTNAVRQEFAWVLGANSYLPADIKILWAKEVADDFHARFSALERTYCYVVYNHDIAPAILHANVTWFRPKLDLAALDAACKLFIGEHDFSAFRAAQCQAKTAVRTIIQFDVEQQGDLIIFKITANAFLYHMIRNLMGAILKVGAGKADLVWLESVLQAKDRRKAPKMAAPNGLYLTQIKYDVSYGLSYHRYAQPWFLAKGPYGR